MGKDRPLAGIAICGPSKTGKKTLSQGILKDALERLVTEDPDIEIWNGQPQRIATGVFRFRDSYKVDRNELASYLVEVCCLVYVIDSSASEDGLDRTKRHLHKFLADGLVQTKPVLLLANKQDKPKARPPEEIAARMDLSQFKSLTYRMEGCTGLASRDAHLDAAIMDVRVGLHWLLKETKQRYVEISQKNRRDAAAMQLVAKLSEEMSKLKGWRFFLSRERGAFKRQFLEAVIEIQQFFDKNPVTNSSADVEEMNQIFHRVHTQLKITAEQEEQDLKVEQLVRDLEDVDGQLEHAKFEIDQATDEVRDLLGQRESLRQQLDRAVKDMKEAQEANDKAQRYSVALEKEVEELRTLREVDAERMALKDKVTELNAVLEKEVEELRVVHAEDDQNRQAKEKLAALNAMLVLEIESLKRKREEDAHVIRRMELALEITDGDTDIQQERKVVSEERKRLMVERDGFRQERDRYKAENEQLGLLVQQLTDKVQALEQAREKDSAVATAKLLEMTRLDTVEKTRSRAPSSSDLRQRSGSLVASPKHPQVVTHIDVRGKDRLKTPHEKAKVTYLTREQLSERAESSKPPPRRSSVEKPPPVALPPVTSHEEEEEEIDPITGLKLDIRRNFFI
mmetsp:Transcript_9108/g.14939  ORF Transcript_9108/g.14939 Transcript_9108/m.14939 type:complete len:625 (+) Transcript_9108:3-1877(+)